MEYVKKILPLVEEIPNNIVQNEYIKIISDRMKIDEKALIREVNRNIKSYATSNKDFKPIVTKSSNIGEKAQKNLLSLFLVNVSSTEKKYLTDGISNVTFRNEKLIIIKNTIDKILCEINNDVDVLIRSLYSEFAQDNELKDIITDIIFIAESFKGLTAKDYRTAVDENIEKIKRYEIECEKNEMKSKYKQISDDDVEALQFQIQLREKIKNKQKIGE